MLLSNQNPTIKKIKNKKTKDILKDSDISIPTKNTFITSHKTSADFLFSFS